MKTVRFIAETFEELQGAAYKVGDIRTFSAPSADRWIRRNVAVEIVDEPAAPKLKMNRPMMGGKPEPIVPSGRDKNGGLKKSKFKPKGI